MNERMHGYTEKWMNVLIWSDLKWFDLKLDEIKFTWNALSSTNMNWKEMKQQKRRGTQLMMGIN